MIDDFATYITLIRISLEEKTDYSLHINTMRLRQNYRHFADIFKCIFFIENLWIWITISLKFVSNFWIDNKPELVEIMAWCQTDDKQLPEPVMVWFTDAYMLLSLNELINFRFPIFHSLM